MWQSLDFTCKHALQVRVVEFNASTSFEEQLQVMAGTGVLVSVHTSNLANAQFLQPGSAVVELLQRNWVWHNLDKSFQVCSLCFPDLHRTTVTRLF